MHEHIIRNIIDKIKDSHRILITAHQRLDPDSLGSMLALYHSLKKIGKEPIAACLEPVPSSLTFVPHTEIIKADPTFDHSSRLTLFSPDIHLEELTWNTAEDGRVEVELKTQGGSYQKQDLTFKAGGQFDMVITVDAGDEKNLGSFYERNREFFKDATVVNIDHHVTNDLFGDINLVDTKVSSAAELVYYVISQLDPTLIDKDIATYLLLGIIADTGSFQHDNTTPSSLQIAAKLVDLGADREHIIKHLYKTKKLDTLKMWGKVLSSLKTDEEHHILWSSIPHRDFKTLNTTTEETKLVIDELMSNAPNIDFIVLIRETKPKHIEASIRTTSMESDGAAIAKQFGGGGHTQASGFTVEGMSLADLEEKLIQSIRDAQRAKRPGSQPEPKPRSLPKYLHTGDETLAPKNDYREAQPKTTSREKRFADRIKKTFMNGGL